MTDGWWVTRKFQCGQLSPHVSHEVDRVDVPPEFNPMVCGGVGEKHCTMEIGHDAHAFDFGDVRNWCEGTVVEPEPEPRYPEQSCDMPGGCENNPGFAEKGGHVFLLNGESYWCTGSTMTAAQMNKRAAKETKANAKS